MRKKSLLRRLIPWAVLLCALAAFVFFVLIPVYSQQERSFGREVNDRLLYEGDGKPLTMENGDLLFEMDANTTQFQVTNKATGKVWHSNPEGRENDPLARGANLDYLSSTLTVTYYDSVSQIELNNYTYSISNQNYTIEPQEDGSIRVNYAVGKIDRKYLIPTAITKERFTSFTDQMSSKNKSKTKNYYVLYDPEKLDSKKNKDEIIALYPSVTEQALYILKDDVKPNQKQDVENFLAEVGYTEDDYNLDNELIAGEKSTNAAVFNVSVIYRLEGKDLVVEIPYDEITCRSDYPITGVTPLPVFGAAGTDRNGFMLVPEGGGALINFNNGKLSQSSYYANTYGWDYGKKRTEVISETEAAFPVFGVSEEDGAFLCMMEHGSSYASVAADISGRIYSYNIINAKYTVLNSDTYDVTGRTAQLLLMFESKIPSDTVVQRYRFLDGNGYVAMAETYGAYLAEQPDMKGDVAAEDMPVNIELIGAIDKKEVKFGMPVDSTVALTTFDQADTILSDLVDGGVKDLNVRYTGWSNGGVQQKVLSKVNVLWELGGDEGAKKLISSAKARDVDLYFDGISTFAYRSGLLQGFIPFIHAARYATREVVEMYPYDIVTYRESDWMEPFQMIRPELSQQYAGNLINWLNRRGNIPLRIVLL